MKNWIYFSLAGDFSSIRPSVMGTKVSNRECIIMSANVTPLQQERLQYLLHEYNSTKNTPEFNPDILDSLASMIKRIKAEAMQSY